MILQLPFNLPDSVPGEVHEAFRQHANSIQDLQQSIVGPGGILAQIKGLKGGTASSSALTTQTINSETIIAGASGNVGAVNDQSGVTAYATQQADNGSLIVLDDASPVALSLSGGLTVPWFAIPVNLGAGLVTMTPASGTVNGASSLPLAEGYFAIVAFDGTNFFAATLPLPAFQSLTTTGSGAATLSGGVLNIPPPVSPSGATGTITLAHLTLTGAQGSITIVNGIITAFVNPT